MFWKALVVWLGLVPAMVVNGALRDFGYRRFVGEPVARAISSFTGSAIVLAAAYLLVRWIGVLTAAEALAIGALWLILTVTFEFGLGRATGTCWAELRADYNVLAGRLWILVLLSAALGPWFWATRV